MIESEEIRRLSKLLEQEPPRGSSSEWIERVSDIRRILSDLEIQISQMHLAPSIEEKFSTYVRDMKVYFKDLTRHHDAEQNPRLRRLGRRR